MTTDQHDEIVKAARDLCWSLSHRPARERQPYRDEYLRLCELLGVKP